MSPYETDINVGGGWKYHRVFENRGVVTAETDNGGQQLASSAGYIKIKGEIAIIMAKYSRLRIGRSRGVALRRDDSAFRGNSMSII